MGIDYRSIRWKRLRKKALKRDGFKCCRCRRYGKSVGATTVHHKKCIEKYPELAYDLDNLESLCAACHNKAHPEKGGTRQK